MAAHPPSSSIVGKLPQVAKDCRKERDGIVFIMMALNRLDSLNRWLDWSSSPSRADGAPRAITGADTWAAASVVGGTLYEAINLVRKLDTTAAWHAAFRAHPEVATRLAMFEALCDTDRSDGFHKRELRLLRNGIAFHFGETDGWGGAIDKLTQTETTLASTWNDERGRERWFRFLSAEHVTFSRILGEPNHTELGKLARELGKAVSLFLFVGEHLVGHYLLAQRCRLQEHGGTSPVHPPCTGNSL